MKYMVSTAMLTVAADMELATETDEQRQRMSAASMRRNQAAEISLQACASVLAQLAASCQQKRFPGKCNAPPLRIPPPAATLPTHTT